MDGIAASKRPDRELVPDRDVLRRPQIELRVLLHDPARQGLARLHAFDHDDADAVLLVVHYEIDHRCFP